MLVLVLPILAVTNHNLVISFTHLQLAAAKNCFLQIIRFPHTSNTDCEDGIDSKSQNETQNKVRFHI